MSERVLFFVTELGRGGAETQLVRIVGELRGRGWEAEVVSLMEPVGYVDRLREVGVPLHSLGLVRGRPTARALARAIVITRACAPDLICTFLYHATVLGSLAALAAGRVPLVSSMRDPVLGGPPRRLTLVRALHRMGLIRKTVVNSALVYEQLHATGALPAEQLALIPNGIDTRGVVMTPAEREALRASLGVSSQEFLWLHVGNFQRLKDHPSLLAAFERLFAMDASARLRLVGLGEAPPEIAARLRELAPGALHLGERNDVPSLMAACDGLVLSSISEGLPNAIMEAQLAERPVVSTDVGGVRELVDDGRTGVLVPAGDPAALAGAMLRVMRLSEPERRALGAAARRSVVERYDVGRVASLWEALFRDVVARTRLSSASSKNARKGISGIR